MIRGMFGFDLQIFFITVYAAGIFRVFFTPRIAGVLWNLWTAWNVGNENLRVEILLGFFGFFAVAEAQMLRSLRLGTRRLLSSSDRQVTITWGELWRLPDHHRRDFLTSSHVDVIGTQHVSPQIVDRVSQVFYLHCCRRRLFLALWAARVAHKRIPIETRLRSLCHGQEHHKSEGRAQFALIIGADGSLQRNVMSLASFCVTSVMENWIKDSTARWLRHNFQLFASLFSHSFAFTFELELNWITVKKKQRKITSHNYANHQSWTRKFLIARSTLHRIYASRSGTFEMLQRCIRGGFADGKKQL